MSQSTPVLNRDMKALYNSIASRKATMEEINNLGSQLIQTENRKLERLENLYKENEKEKTRKALQTQMKELKRDKGKFLEWILDINKEIESHRAGIEVLDNYKTFSAGLVNNTESRMTEFMNTKGRKNMSEDDRMKMLQFSERLQKEYNRRESERNKLSEELIHLETSKAGYKQQLEALDIELNKLNQQYKKLKSELLFHYHNILSEGRDTRHEGLSWVIKAIWNLNSNVMISHLPRFLDDKLIEYLLKLSHKDVEAQNVKAELDYRRDLLKRRIKRSKTLKKRSTDTNLIFKTEQQVYIF
jgi:chromosome segregation ATPase